MDTRKAGMRFILVTLFLDIFGIGLVVPIIPKLIGDFVSGESEASRMYGLFIAVYAIMQFFFSPILGSLSDHFGRRPVLLASLGATVFNYLLLAFAPSLGLLFAGRVFAGIAGASIGTATAYIADVSPPEKRAQNFGLIGAAFGLGFIAGPALGGLLGGLGVRVPFLVAAGLGLLNTIYGIFVLPESLDVEHRRPFHWSRAQPFGTLIALARYPAVLGLGATIFLVYLAQRGLESTWVLYTSHRYAWGIQTTGLSFALVGVFAAIVQGGLVRKVVPRIGEQKAVLFGIAVTALAFIGYGLAPQGWVILSIVPLASLGGIAGPAAQGILSKAVPANEQGMLQGGLASLASITQIIGPMISTYLFGYFIEPTAPVYLPGVAFFMGSGFLVIALGLAARSFARGVKAASEAPVAADSVPPV